MSAGSPKMASLGFKRMFGHTWEAYLILLSGKQHCVGDPCRTKPSVAPTNQRLQQQKVACRTFGNRKLQTLSPLPQTNPIKAKLAFIEAGVEQGVVRGWCVVWDAPYLLKGTQAPKAVSTSLTWTLLGIMLGIMASGKCPVLAKCYGHRVHHLHFPQ